MKTIDQIRQEFERLGFEMRQGDLHQSAEGVILGLDEMTGHPDIIEISETGPGSAGGEGLPPSNTEHGPAPGS